MYAYSKINKSAMNLTESKVSGWRKGMTETL